MNEHLLKDLKVTVLRDKLPTVVHLQASTTETLALAANWSSKIPGIGKKKVVTIAAHISFEVETVERIRKLLGVDPYYAKIKDTC